MAATQSVYTTDNIAVPTDVQNRFVYQYHPSSDPERARIDYMKVMHEHTKQQYQMATASSRRRASPNNHDIALLNQASVPPPSGSVSSTASS